MYAYQNFRMDESSNDLLSQDGSTFVSEKCTPYGLPFGKTCIPARRQSYSAEESLSSQYLEDQFPETRQNSTVERLLNIIDEQLRTQTSSTSSTTKERFYSRPFPSVKGLPHPSQLRGSKERRSRLRPRMDVVTAHMQQLHRKSSEMLSRSVTPAESIASSETTFNWDGSPLCVSVRRTPSTIAKSTLPTTDSTTTQFIGLPLDTEEMNEMDMPFQPKLTKGIESPRNSCQHWWEVFHAEE